VLDLGEEYKRTIRLHYGISLLSIYNTNNLEVKYIVKDLVNDIVEEAITKVDRPITYINIPREIFLRFGNYLYDKAVRINKDNKINLSKSIIENYYRVE